MTGRGIDQILPFPSQPKLREGFVKNARDYVLLAEQYSGRIEKPVPFSYIWGAALKEFNRVKPDARVINLETAITQSEDWAVKGINYRMHPNNIECLTSAKIDCCVLGNNHILDFSYSGLSETIETLSKAGIKSAGAGENAIQAKSPAILNIQDKGRVLVFSFGMESSGVPKSWAATANQPGLHLLEDLSNEAVKHIASLVEQFKRPANDVAIASIHWGPNWGYEIAPEEISFAHSLIEEAGINVVHGHSSHHPKAFEIYQDCPIFYGCGDFITDYEGITGYEEFRGDLGLMYFVTINVPTGKLSHLELVPTQMKHLRVNYATKRDARWLRDVLNRESQIFGTEVDFINDRTLSLQNS